MKTLAAFFICAPVMALAIEPTPSPGDATQCTVAYDPMKSIELKQYSGDQTTVLFGNDEHLDAALPSTDKTHLLVAAKTGDNFMVVKSVGETFALRSFQITVRMNVSGDEPTRTYQFEYISLKPQQPQPESPTLVAANTSEIPVGLKGPAPEPKLCHVVRVLHPKEDAAAAQKKAQAGWLQAQRIKAEQALRRSQMDASKINVQYSFQGDRRIGPHGDPNGATLADRADIWDDGVTTVLHFPGNQRIPTIYTIGDDGNDAQSINVAPEDNGIIKLPSVYAGIRLRLDGTKALCIYNLHIQDNNPNNGTTSPSVGRGLRSDAR